MRELLRARLADARAELMALSGARGLGELPERIRGASREARGARLALLASVRRLPDRFENRASTLGARVLAWPTRAALPHRAAEPARDGRPLAERLRARLASAGERLGAEVGRMRALDPLRVLERGYAVASREGEPAPLRDAAAVAPGDVLRILLERGELTARVERTRPGARRREEKR
jgi:exodeoxyribonuclease VII large subunit